MSWSGGKDSAYALYTILQQGIYEVKYLLSSFDADSKKIAAHGIPENLIEEQAKQMDIALVKIYIKGSSNIEYEKQMATALSATKATGIYHVIFGDIFLEDLRQYREEKLRALDMFAVFPLWKMDTQVLVKDFIAKGFRTITCCVNDAWLSKQWVGREINSSFTGELANHIDPCGENGEYHSFCFAGPVFKEIISIKKGNIHYKSLLLNAALKPGKKNITLTKGFWYCDIALATSGSKPEVKTCPRCNTLFECKAGDVLNCHC